MNPAQIHASAQQIFAHVLAEVVDSHLANPTPCPGWDVAALIGHIDDGNRWVIDLGGRTQPEPSPHRGQHHAATAAGAQAVFDAADGMTRVFDLPFGQIPGGAFAVIRAGDLYTHAWDLATAIGSDTDLDADVGEAVLAATTPFLTPQMRGEGRPFGDEQPCDEERPVADRVAAFFGRPVS